jgi:hypothetical protein
MIQTEQTAIVTTPKRVKNLHKFSKITTVELLTILYRLGWSSIKAVVEVVTPLQPTTLSIMLLTHTTIGIGLGLLCWLLSNRSLNAHTKIQAVMAGGRIWP